MRQIVLMRHGEAEDHSPDGDRGRRLTSRGSEAVRAAARTLVRLGWVTDAVLHSPYTRATETARLVADAREGSATLTPDAVLVPNGSAHDAVTRVLAEGRDVLVVSHLPLLPAMLDVLLGAACPFFLAPGSAVCLRTIGATRAAVTGFLAQDELVSLDARG